MTAHRVAGRDPILIVGGYGYRNTGDEAMLAGILERLRGHRVTVVSRMPAETEAMHGVRAVSIGQAVGELRTHRTILIGGGSLFGRDMGRLGSLLPLYGLFARAMGRHIVVEGVGLDEAPSRLAKPFVRQLLSAARDVAVRDAQSLALIRCWGIQARQIDDLSLLMREPAASVGRKLLHSAGVDDRRRVVGLCLTAVDADLSRRVTSAVGEAMAANRDVDFVFIPMSRHPFVASHNDLALAHELHAAHPELHVLEGDHHPAALLSVFRSLDAAVCMRFHSLLFAERTGTPMVSYAYAPKCTAWLAERGLCSADPSADALTAAIGELLGAERMVV